MNKNYPIMLDLTGRSCLVVGGGKVAARKIKTLLHSGAKVTVISPQAVPSVAQWSEEARITWHQEEYVSQDVRDYAFVFAATNRPEVNLAVYEAVQKHGGWINIIDRPDLCNFTVPASVHRGKLVISVSTSGASPGLSRQIRKKMEEDYGSEYEGYVNFLADVRELVMTEIAEPNKRKEIFTSLLDESFVTATEAERYRRVAALLGKQEILPPDARRQT